MNRKIAFAFGGQGSEFAGAGRAWRDDEIFSIASRASRVDIAHAVERLSRDLKRTSILQAALVAISCAALERLVARGVKPAFVCGHSVGEVSAWVASGAIDPREAIAFAVARGAAMERAAETSPGAMLATESTHETAKNTAFPNVEIAARNGPRQIVLTGSVDAIDEAKKQLGGRRLDVSGPWHSRAMSAAREDTRRALDAITPRAMKIPLVTCLDGSVLSPDHKPDFVAQLTAPVDWTAVCAALEREQITDVVCVCPGRVNRGLFRDVFAARIALHLADDDGDIDRVARKLAENT